MYSDNIAAAIDNEWQVLFIFNNFNLAHTIP